jgi:hypothetical protein
MRLRSTAAGGQHSTGRQRAVFGSHRGAVSAPGRGEAVAGCAAAAAALYASLHLLLVAALAAFGQRVGGYPLHSVGIVAYAALAAAGAAVSLRAAARGGSVAGRLAPVLALAPLLASALAGAFFATGTLGGIGPPVGYAPYALDEDGQSSWLHAGVGLWVVAVALTARWRGLLVAAMGGQGLALALNPGLVGTLRWGFHPDHWPLLALLALYLGGAVALGWRPRPVHLLAAAAGLLAAAVAVAALGMLVVFPEFRDGAARSPAMAAELPWRLLVTGALLAAALGSPLAAWRLRRWASAGIPPAPLAAAGAGLALVGGVALLSWHYLVPGASDNFLPAPGRTMGWIGKTVAADAYGAPGEALFALAAAFPWLAGAAGLVWLAALLTALARARPRPTLSLGLAALGYGALLQSPVSFLFAFHGPSPPPVRGLAMALAAEERGLQSALIFGLPLLGLSLLGAGAALRGPAGRQRGWLVLAGTVLALVAAATLSGGLVAGTLQELEFQGRLTADEQREAARLRLALSLVVNGAFAVVGWAVVAGGIRALREPPPAGLPPAAIRRGAAGAAAGLATAGLTFWWLTAMPIAETRPAHGATGVPTNHPLVVRLAPGERNWGPGMCARYAGGDRCVGGASMGYAGGVSFVPDGGWRPNARVEVRVCCGPFTRGYAFSFTTGDGPAADVPTPPGPARAPAPGYPSPPRAP